MPKTTKPAPTEARAEGEARGRRLFDEAVAETAAPQLRENFPEAAPVKRRRAPKVQA